ncbi:DgyrCDS14892 [Dimorphilus gyrociliatus]|uniref:DgyrCDS14892 n=1 Tax=Dimorphilus gyrociliatus TaxID=2664684 RepID=A0A7I8WFA8_9ANNE|nr:DgyrCDS14892 [Dimorphilus gyrociliatus]
MKFVSAIVVIALVLQVCQSSSLLDLLREEGDELVKRGSDDLDSLETAVICEFVMAGIDGSRANAGSTCNTPRTIKLSTLKLLKNEDNLKKICYAACIASGLTGVCASRCGVSRFFELGK